MTEDEAKTKTCPLTFSMPAHYAPDGGGIRDAGPWPCIASACMAWRWGDAITAPRNPHPRYEKVPTGYCGLAGEPLERAP